MEMTELEKVIRGLREIDMFIAGRLEHEKAKNFLRTIDETIMLLKEQEERLCKLQKDKDKLCLDISEWKHKFHERPLKEKEAAKPILDEQTGRLWLCGECGSYVGFEDNDPHDPNEFDKYCRECGRPVLWEGR